jgi:hypothetical protein
MGQTTELRITQERPHLTRDEVKKYEREGFVFLRKAFGVDEVSQLRSSLAEIVRRPDNLPGGARVLHEEPPAVSGQRRAWAVSNLAAASDTWFRLAVDPRIVVPMVDLLGPDINLFNTFARIKLPLTQAHLDWHQDWPHDRHNLPGLLTALLYLDDTWEGAAATECAVGSHLRGELPADSRHSLRDEQITDPKTVLPAQAGDLLLLHTMTVHRATTNSTKDDRRVALVVGKVAGLFDLTNTSWSFKELPLARGGMPFDAL